MLLGLIRPTSGTVRINAATHYFPQQEKAFRFKRAPLFYEHLSVRETLRFAHGLGQGYAKSGDADIGQALNAVELSGAADAKVKDLSKGMQQRLSMAQALLGNSDIFILDEPMSGLDPLGRRLFREILLALAQEGKTIFSAPTFLMMLNRCAAMWWCCLRAGLSIRGSFRSFSHKAREEQIVLL